jgi:2-amino-4-hydroxy-6-hydroxymethyldihydropteridine diphosphokinase
MQHTAAIALGSNLGDSLLTLNTAVAHLDGLADLRVLACSSWYRTAPIGPPQPDYLNGCLLLTTSLTPQSLMQQLLSVETHFGRERRERWGARTLDLDLLLFDDVVVFDPDLTIPHPRMNSRLCARPFSGDCGGLDRSHHGPDDRPSGLNNRSHRRHPLLSKPPFNQPVIISA